MLRIEIQNMIHDLGITMRHAARLADIAPGNLSRFLRGQKTLGVDNVDRLRDALQRAAARKRAR